MNTLAKNLTVILLLLILGTSKSYSAAVTQVDVQILDDAAGEDTNEFMGGVVFNDDGTKMFTSYHNVSNNNATGRSDDVISQYTLSVPFDISTASYDGASEQCSVSDDDATFANPTTGTMLGFRFSDDGMKIFVAQRGMNGLANSFINRLDLTTAYDVSTCSYIQEINMDTDLLQNGTNAGPRENTADRNNLQGIEITNDGTKLFIVMNDRDGVEAIKQYNFSTPYDLSTISIAPRAIVLQTNNPFGISFSNNGKRLFASYIGNNPTTGFVEQYTLTNAYDLSSFTLDGQVDLEEMNSAQNDLISISFSNNGLKMFSVHRKNEKVFEYNLACPFTVVEGKCESITQNSDRTGIAEAQIELANRTIKLSTNSALNRLKWIRRNKDKQNLSNQNIKFNFSNSILSSLKTLPISSIKKISATKDTNSISNLFYWSEGSVMIGKVGDNSIASAKDIKANSFTFGFDKVMENLGIKGLAFRIGSDNVDVGTKGSNLDASTYNITYYSTSPIKNDTKHVDTIIGIGKIRSNILTVVDDNKHAANRTGQQLYFSHKIKDEIKKNNLTFIPSAQIDFGHTILNKYTETGKLGLEFDDQHVRTRNLRAAIAYYEDLSNDRVTIKRHGKLEYLAHLFQSSSVDYKHNNGGSFVNTKLETGARHNLNGEIGLDIVLPDSYSIFIIYERNQAFDSGHNEHDGHNDNLYIAIGYLPGKNTEYAFTLNGSENLMSKLEVKKDIKGFDLIFNLNDDLTNLGDAREAHIELNKVF